MLKPYTINKSHEDFSIRLTKWCLVLLAVCAIVMLLSGPRIVGIMMLRTSPWLQGALRYYLLLGSGYVLGTLALIVIVQLFHLVDRIGQGEVFIPTNVRSLQLIGWNVGVVAIMALIISITCYLPVLAIAIAGTFMTLIIRVVRNAFGKAVQMQDELDYTI
ncbi:DUF2975 domain-containing protein [Aerococcaceae bacterium NML190073]|nr:DUF2975 domain-containing protein [Aerococcaceae bacterium NML190073]